MKLFGKRFWASVLSLLMMLSVVPMQAFAEEMVYSEDASAASSQAVPSSSDTLATSNALSESAESLPVQSGQEGSTPVVSKLSEATSSSESDLEESPSPAVSSSNQQGKKILRWVLHLRIIHRMQADLPVIQTRLLRSPRRILPRALLQEQRSN